MNIFGKMLALETLRLKLNKAKEGEIVGLTLAEFLMILRGEADNIIKDCSCEECSQDAPEGDTSDFLTRNTGVTNEEKTAIYHPEQGLSMSLEGQDKVFELTVTPENIVKGDTITVNRWISGKDKSYVGDFLTVKHIALPYVFLECRNKYYPAKPDVLQLSFDEVVFERLTPEFVTGFQWMCETIGKKD